MTNKELQDCIIYQDFHYLIANKPAGIKSQQDHTPEKSFHKLLEKHINKSLFLVHRLDRPTSGIMVFAKKKSAATHLGKLQQENHPKFKKVYLAAVKNPPKEQTGALEHHLIHDKKQRKSIVINEATKESRLARLSYKTIAQIEHYSLLEIALDSGRFHQIRAQLAAAGSPVKGDVKYGARRGNRDRSINLHAYKMEIPMRAEGEGITVLAQLPDDAVWNAFKEINSELGHNKIEKWKEELM